MTVDLTVFRLVAYETPLWAFSNVSNGRYNRANAGPPTQYLSLHPMTPWAEMLRNLNRRTADEARAMRMPLWTTRVSLADEPVVIDFDAVGAYGLSAGDLVDDDQTSCRSLAQGLYGSGVRSFYAPSAALPGTTNLIVMEPAAVIDFHEEPFSSIDWPTALAAQDARCPEGLWDLVHYWGAGVPHAALDAWENGDTHIFEQPLVTADSLVAA